jgi:hypothetical protein
MAAWVVCALCALVIIKPQEFIPALAGLPLLYILAGLAVVLGALEIALGRLRIAMAPHVPAAVGFLLWAIFTTAVKRPSALAKEGVDLCIVLCTFLLLALFAGSSSGLRLFAATFLGCALLVTGVAIVQAERPFGCMLAAPDDWEGKGELEPDGRECETAFDCRKDAPQPDGNYRCERAGPFGTATIGGRVRYRGSLADPNEISLMASMAIPFALAMAERRKRRKIGTQGAPPRRHVEALPHLLGDRLLSRFGAALRAIPVMGVLGAIAVMIILSKSRMGLLVFMVVVGISFLRRAGPWGLVIGCVLFPPMLLLGGRSGAEADASTDERVALLSEALGMIRRTKGLGLGVGQFAGESTIGLTAHNSYVLAGAETGILGMCLFGLLLYLGLKVPISLWLGEHDLGPALSRLCPAVAIGLAGGCVGIFFVSWSYKDILYMMLGASAALYQAARAREPRVRVRLSLREAALVCGASLLLLPLLYVAVHIHG